MQIWAEFLRSPRALRLEYRALGEGDAVRYYSEHVVPTQGITGFVGTISDITDLVETRTLLEAVISDMPVALLACDTEGRTRIAIGRRSSCTAATRRIAATWRTYCSRTE